MNQPCSCLEPTELSAEEVKMLAEEALEPCEHDWVVDGGGCIHCGLSVEEANRLSD